MERYPGRVGSTSRSAYQPVEDQQGSGESSSRASRRHADSGPLAGLREMREGVTALDSASRPENSTHAPRQATLPLHIAYEQLEILEEQVQTGKISEESYRLQADRLMQTVFPASASTDVASSPPQATGPRTPYVVWRRAYEDIRRGTPAHEAIERHGLTHPEDIERLIADSDQIAEHGTSAPASLLLRANEAIRRLTSRNPRRRT